MVGALCLDLDIEIVSILFVKIILKMVKMEKLQEGKNNAYFLLPPSHKNFILDMF
jgi:hypothetical protein